MVTYNHCRVPNILKIDGLNLKLHTFVPILLRATVHQRAIHARKYHIRDVLQVYIMLFVGTWQTYWENKMSQNARCLVDCTTMRWRNVVGMILSLHQRVKWKVVFYSDIQTIYLRIYVDWYFSFDWLWVDRCFRKIILKRSAKFYIWPN